MPLIRRIVERVRSQTDHSRFGHDVQAELRVDDARARFGQVALIGDEAAAAKTARTQCFLQPRAREAR